MDGCCSPGGRLRLRGWPLRHHQRAQLGIRGEHTMEADQVQPGPWHQRRQPLHEFQRAHHQLRSAVAPGCLELELHLTCIVELHPLVCQRRTGDVVAQLFQPLALVRFDAHGRVKAESVDVAAQELARHALARNRAAQRQDLMPGALSRWRCGK